MVIGGAWGARHGAHSKDTAIDVNEVSGVPMKVCD